MKRVCILLSTVCLALFITSCGSDPADISQEESFVLSSDSSTPEESLEAEDSEPEKDHHTEGKTTAIFTKKTKNKGTMSVTEKATTVSPKKTTTTATSSSGKFTYDDYIQYRHPLTHTYRCLTEKKALKIVYFGGSVTVGYGAKNTSKDSWRALTTTWMKKQFPDANISTVNAAIGDTGTFLGVYRVQPEVIAQKPDLLFIEYAINDYYNGSDQKTAALQYETIVREVRKALPECDIVTVLVTDNTGNAEYSVANTCFPQAAGHESIAKAYDIPTVNVGNALVCKMAKETQNSHWYTDAALWGKYFIDIVHPTNAGYKEYYLCVEHFLKTSLESKNFTEASTESHSLPKVVSEHLLDGNRQSIFKEDMKNVVVAAETKGFTYSNESYFGSRTGCYVANKGTDASIAIKINGTELAIWTNFISPSKIAYSVDGGAEKTITCDSHSQTKVVSGLKSGTHTITIRPVSYGNDSDPTMKIGAIFTRDASKETKKGAN